MIILGVDPGTLVTGYGVIESGTNGVSVLAYGIIKNDGKRPMPVRLKQIYDVLTNVIRDYKPDEFAIETAFYGKNAQSALKLGQARGVAILAAVGKDLPIKEYAPREVKKALVGAGNASKQQVQFMVQSLLKLKKLPERYDVTDALAVAVCHLNRTTTSAGRKQYSSWKAFIADHPERISTH